MFIYVYSWKNLTSYSRAYCPKKIASYCSKYRTQRMLRWTDFCASWRPLTNQMWYLIINVFSITQYVTKHLTVISPFTEKLRFIYLLWFYFYFTFARWEGYDHPAGWEIHASWGNGGVCGRWMPPPPMENS